jgi:hypothetical protein
VNKVLPPGSLTSGGETDVAKISKILNGEGSKDRPIDLESSPAGSEPSPPTPSTSAAGLTITTTSRNAPPVQVNGCQIFPGTTYQNGKNILNNHKIYQMATKYSKWQ